MVDRTKMVPFQYLVVESVALFCVRNNNCSVEISGGWNNNCPVDVSGG